MTSTVLMETAKATPTRRKTVNLANRWAGVNRSHFLCSAIEHLLDLGRQIFTDHDQRDDRQQNSAQKIIVEALEGCEQGTTNTAGPDNADHSCVPEVGVELIGGESDEPVQDLRQDRENEHTHERRSGRPHGLYRLEGNFLDSLGKQFADKPDRRKDQSQNACQGPEADSLDEQNSEN